MRTRKDRADTLDLSGMQSGDWFAFCECCVFQGEKNTGMKPKCPNCGTGLIIGTVTKEDMGGKDEDRNETEVSRR